MPVLTVHAGRSAPGQRAAASHTAAAAAPLITRQALFEQAGIIATDDLGELLDAAVLLATQPVPAGSRVAIVSNAGGAGVLAADACVEAGLSVATPSRRAAADLAAILPPGAALGGPVDTTAAVRADAFGAALATVAVDTGVDAVLALVVPTAAADLVPALSAARLPVPLAAWSSTSWTRSSSGHVGCGCCAAPPAPARPRACSVGVRPTPTRRAPPGR